MKSRRDFFEQRDRLVILNESSPTFGEFVGDYGRKT